MRADPAINGIGKGVENHIALIGYHIVCYGRGQRSWAMSLRSGYFLFEGLRRAICRCDCDNEQSAVLAGASLWDLMDQQGVPVLDEL